MQLFVPNGRDLVEMSYDLIVVGGGPAGCAAAITTSRAGGRVLLLERGHYPRHKVCGEFMSPESLAVLSSLLLPEDWRRFLDGSPKIRSIRVMVDGQTIRARIEPSALSVARYELDLAMWRACEQAGVDARQDMVAEHIEDSHSVSVAGGRSFVAHAVLNAAGRWSNLRQHRPDSSQPRFVGLKAHFAEADPPLSADLYFFKGGYCGVQAVGHNTVNVCAMVRADIAARLEDVFTLEPQLHRRSRGWTPLMNPVSTFPLVFCGPLPVRDGVLCSGDAAGFIDPFVGDGISLALQTGVAAAHALRSVWKDGQPLTAAAGTYTMEYKRSFEPVFRRAAKVRSLFDLPLPLRVMAAWIAQIPVISSSLLKLTRAA